MSKKKWMDHPDFDKGIEASVNGLRITDNPLDPNSYSFRKWNEGWVENELSKKKQTVPKVEKS